LIPATSQPKVMNTGFPDDVAQNSTTCQRTALRGKERRYIFSSLQGETHSLVPTTARLPYLFGAGRLELTLTYI